MPKIVVMYNLYENKTKEVGDNNGELEFFEIPYDMSKRSLEFKKYYGVDIDKYLLVNKKQANKFFNNCPDISTNEIET